MAGEGEEGSASRASSDDLHIRTFLIADVRGWTVFTQEKGDEGAGKLAAKFARIVREVVEGRGGKLLELRGDEAMCVFGSPRQAIRAAADLQDRFVEETLADPELPLTVGMGLDAGEAVEVEGGYRGGALNLAARLCSQALAGEILGSREVAHLARRVEGVRYEDRGTLSLKGLAEPVHVVRVVPEDLDAVARLQPYAPAAPRPDRRQRPPWAAIAAAALALVLLAVAIPILRSGRDVEIGSNSVARLAAGDARVELATPLGQRLGASAVGFGSLWVAQPDDARVVRVDLEDGEVVDTIEVGTSPAGVAIGDGAVWVTNAGDGTITRIDPGSNFANPPIAAGSRPTGIAFGGGALWVVDALVGDLLRIDPTTGETSQEQPLSGQPAGVAYTDRGVWVAMSPAEVVRLDPESLDVTLQKAVGSGPSDVLPAFGAIWVANRFDGTVSRIDPSTGAVLSAAVGDGPNFLAVAAGAVWVTTEYDGRVTELDPETGAVQRAVRVGPSPASIASDGDGLWLSVGASPTEHLGGTLVVASAEQPKTLDPAVAYEDTFLAWQIFAYTNDGVLAFEKVGGPSGTTLVPDLATALPEVSPDGKTYRFTLREGIRYSNGEPVLPEDFRHGLERTLMLSPDIGLAFFGAIRGAARCDGGAATCDLSEGVETGDGSVTYHLTGPDADLPFKLALPFAYPLPASVPFEDQRLDPVPATGPYLVASANAEKIELGRNESFRQWSGAAQPDGFVDRVTWNVGVDPGSAFGQLDDSLDWLDDPPPSDELDALDLAHPGQVVQAPQARTYFVGFDLSRPPVDDVAVRRAVNYAIARDRVVELLGGPTRQRPTCQIIPPNFAGYERFCPYTLAPEEDVWSAPDMERAQALVREAGVRGEPLRVWVSRSGLPPGAVATMRYVTDVLQDLGLEPKLTILPSELEYFGPIYGGLPTQEPPHVYMSGWQSDYPGGGDFIDTQFHCEGGANASGLCDPHLDRRIERAKQLQIDQPAAANRAWSSIDHELVMRAIWAPLTNEVATHAFSARTENVQIHPQWGPLLSRMWVE
ncbi:MAG TPA: ABC transporter substrate-binding protein [Actinomycetota bacterium]|nr:ABC transporter substrate-binding protein [Actinomycetota bacterium]